MAPPSTEDQLKFLLTCIKHSNAGKVDFGLVANECEIVSKGAAAKRYERLIKAHGITPNNGGGRAGSPGSSASASGAPSTPATGKAGGKSRITASKKRKLAARGDDVDEDVKTEVKTEVKNELTDNEIDGSYITHPTDALPDVKPLVTAQGVAYSGNAEEEVFLVSDGGREYGPPTPLAFMHQMLMPPSPENFYGFVDHYTGDMAMPVHPSMIPTSTPMPNEHDAHEHDADHPLQTARPEQVAGHWLQHQRPTFF